MDCKRLSYDNNIIKEWVDWGAVLGWLLKGSYQRGIAQV